MDRAMRLRDRLFTECPACIYCGGTAKAETIDHMPPRALFLGRLRPKGMEYSCCGPCNEGSKAAEQAVALFSRFHPEPTDAQEWQELFEIVRALENNQPAIMEEMLKGPAGKPAILAQIERKHEDLVAVEIGGPKSVAALDMFAGKLALALHYQNTKVIVPANGGAYVRWYTNLQVLRGEPPAELVALLGPRVTLRQGANEVSEQFEYRSSIADQGNSTTHYARFRQSFAVAAVVVDNVDKWQLDQGNAGGGKVFRPGFLRQKDNR